LCNPNWGEILKQNVYVLTFIFIFEKVTRNFGLNVKWNLSNIHTDGNGVHGEVTPLSNWTSRDGVGSLVRNYQLALFGQNQIVPIKGLGMVMLVHRKLHSHDFPTHILFHLNISRKDFQHNRVICKAKLMKPCL
jgi:hypothetical protein